MTYEAWRISYQSSEQAARAAYEECMRLRAELTDLRNSMTFRTSLIGRIEAERKELLEALQNIAEYWNQDQNEAAMADACWHAIHTARAAIAKATGDQP